MMYQATLVIVSVLLWNLGEAPSAQSKRLELYVFGSDSCGPCKRFIADYVSDEDGLRSYIDKYFKADLGKKSPHYFRTVIDENGKWSHPKWVAEFEKVTGHTITSIPVFWVRGRRSCLLGYGIPKDLLEHLSKGKK